jgi:hypothetical protein
MISQWARRLRSPEDPQRAPPTVAGGPAAKTLDALRYPPADAGLAVRAPREIVEANADLLERLRLHAATDPTQFQARFGGPLLRLAEQINVLPATATSLFSGEMGLFRACLESGFFAFQASDGRIFTGAENVERRIALESRWRYLCFLAGMFYPLGRTMERVAVTGPKGQVWKRHFSTLTAWAEGEGAERLFVSWGAPDADDSLGPANATLLILPAVVAPENLQMLDDGAAELVSALYQLAVGQAGSARIAHEVVISCWDRIARREAARRPQAFGRLTSGTHQGPYLAGAVRALVEAGTWKVNASALKADREGLYLQWPLAAADLIEFGRSRGYAGWPADAPTLAALLRASNLVEDSGGELGLLEIVGEGGEIQQALKIANPLAVLEDFEPGAFEHQAPVTLAAVMAADPLAKAEAAAASARAVQPGSAGAPGRPSGEDGSGGEGAANATDTAAGALESDTEADSPFHAGDAQAAAAVVGAGRHQHAAKKGGAGGANPVEPGQPPGRKLREAPDVRYADLVPEDIRGEIGSALQIELLGKIIKTWRDRGENSTVMRRIDNGAAIEFNFLATQILNVPTWVDCMARIGLIYAPPHTPGLRIQKVPIPEGRSPVQAVVLSNLACRRLGL